MANFNIVASSKTLTQNAEWSIAKNAAFSTASPRTETGRVSFRIDMSSLVPGDTIEIREYAGVNATTPVVLGTPVTITTAQVYRGDIDQATNAWDLTVKLTTATSRNVTFDVVQDTNDVNAASITANAITAAAVAADAITEIVNGVWDEVLTGATHNVNSSAGKRLRQLGAVAIRTETAQGGGNGVNQIQLDAAASTVSGIYDKNLIVLTAGPGTGQSRVILRYDGATRTATVERNWRTGEVPTSATEFQIFGAAYLDGVSEGLAASGSVNTITLDTGSPDIDDSLVDNVITVYSGTGEGQSRRITAYVGATHVATVERNWTVAPDATSGYIVTIDAPIGPATLATIASNAATAVWSAISEGAETFGDAVRLVGARLFGRATVRDGDGVYVFRDKTDTKDRLSMTRSGTARTVGTRDGT